jgi:hypothetical protein
MKMSDESTEWRDLAEVIPELIATAVAALAPEDREARIAHCQRTGEHGVRLHVTEDDGLLELHWGGRRLVMVGRDALFSGEPLGVGFVNDVMPDTVPDGWAQQ